jgi:hypothetical protein
VTTTPFGFAPSFPVGSSPFGGSPIWGGVQNSFATPVQTPFAGQFGGPFASPIQSWTKPFGWTSPIGFNPWTLTGAQGLPFSATAGWPTASTIPGVTPWNFSSPISPIGATPWTAPATPWGATPWTSQVPFASPWMSQGFSPFSTPLGAQSAASPFGQLPFGQFPFGQTPFGQVPFGQLPFGQVPFGQIPFGQTPWTAPFGQWSHSGLGHVNGFSPISPIGQHVPFVNGVTNGYTSPARNGYTPSGHFTPTGNGVTATSPSGQISAFGQVPFGQIPLGQVPTFGQVSFGQIPFGQVPFAPFGQSPVGYSPFSYSPVTSWPASPYTPYGQGFNGHSVPAPANYPYPHTEGETTPVGVSQRDAA